MALNVHHYKGKAYRVCLDTYLGRRVVGKIAAEEEEAEERGRAIRNGQFGAPAPQRILLTVEQLLDGYLRDCITPERPRSLRSTNGSSRPNSTERRL